MLPPSSSLVKYESPILVNTTKDKPKGGAEGKAKAKSLDISHIKESTTQTEDILNSILPPR